MKYLIYIVFTISAAVIVGAVAMIICKYFDINDFMSGAIVGISAHAACSAVIDFFKVVEKTQDN